MAHLFTKHPIPPLLAQGEKQPAACSVRQPEMQLLKQLQLLIGIEL
jgi:hypothetical protein